MQDADRIADHLIAERDQQTAKTPSRPVGGAGHGSTMADRASRVELRHQLRHCCILDEHHI